MPQCDGGQKSSEALDTVLNIKYQNHTCVYDLLETFYSDNIMTDYVLILDLTLSPTCNSLGLSHMEEV